LRSLRFAESLRVPMPTTAPRPTGIPRAPDQPRATPRASYSARRSAPPRPRARARANRGWCERGEALADLGELPAEAGDSACDEGELRAAPGGGVREAGEPDSEAGDLWSPTRRELERRRDVRLFFVPAEDGERSLLTSGDRLRCDGSRRNDAGRNVCRGLYNDATEVVRREIGPDFLRRSRGPRGRTLGTLARPPQPRSPCDRVQGDTAQFGPDVT
jgi:hypothetical protein